MRTRIVILCVLAFACTTPGQKDPGKQPAANPTFKILPGVGDSTLVQGQPLLHTDPSGDVYLSWAERLDSTHHRMQYALLTDTGWSEAVTIATGSHWFVNWADIPQFASDGKGHYIATYLQKSGPGTYAYDIMLTRSTGGTIWESPVKLNEDGKEAEHGFVSITPNAAGFLLSWLDGRRTNPMPSGAHDHDAHDGGQMTLRAAQLDTLGKKLWEEEVDNRTCDCCQTAVAMSAQGPLIAYRDRSEREIRDIYVAQRGTTGWETRPLHTDGWEINGCPVNGPQVQSRGNTVAVAWYTEAQKQPSVNTAFSADGGRTFGKPTRIHDSIPLGRVDLVLTDEQTAIVGWMEGDRILARASDADGSTGPVALVGRNTAARNGGFPQMARWGQHVVFAWTDAASKRILTSVIPIAALLR